MVDIEILKKDLCKAFCSELSVARIPAGLAFSGFFEDLNGDRLSGYLIEDEDDPYLSDDGTFLNELAASGVDVLGGSRAEFLKRILDDVDAFVDPDTLFIRTKTFTSTPSPEKIIKFLAALVRAQDVSFWTRERIKSTFTEDLLSDLNKRFGKVATVERNGILDKDFSDFPVDILISPKQEGGKKVAVFSVLNVDRLNEAVMLWMEMKLKNYKDATIIPITDTGEQFSFANKKVSRALNRLGIFFVYKGDESEVLEKIGEAANLPAAA